MNSQFVLTIMGEDRPGLTSALSAAIFRCGGNWLEGHLSRLGGLFKLALSEKPEGHDRFILQKVLRDIEASQRELKAAIMRVR